MNQLDTDMKARTADVVVNGVSMLLMEPDQTEHFDSSELVNTIKSTLQSGV